MLPVPVLTLHVPPEVVSGTFTFPVEAFAINILSLSKLPITLPVDVSIFSSFASHSLNFTSPVHTTLYTKGFPRPRYILPCRFFPLDL